MASTSAATSSTNTAGKVPPPPTTGAEPAPTTEAEKTREVVGLITQAVRDRHDPLFGASELARERYLVKLEDNRLRGMDQADRVAAQAAAFRRQFDQDNRTSAPQLGSFAAANSFKAGAFTALRA